MLPSVVKQTAIAKRKDQYLSDKKTMLMIPEVQGNINSSDLEIANAGVELPVRKYDDETLVKKAGILVKFICMDYGIVNSDSQMMQYASTRFVTTLKKYYSDLSLKEIKIAFELASVGELDEWLPKDKHGKPDSKHYNSFNVEYFTKILNAYKTKKSKIWNKVIKLMPVKEMVISKEQREFNKKECISDIYKAFDLYKSKQKQPRFVFNIFIQEFINCELIKEVKKPAKKIIDLVYKNELSNLRGEERKKLVDQYHSKKLSSFLINEAQAYQNNIDISKAFDKIIEQKKDIRDFIKWT